MQIVTTLSSSRLAPHLPPHSCLYIHVCRALLLVFLLSFGRRDLNTSLSFRLKCLLLSLSLHHSTNEPVTTSKLSSQDSGAQGNPAAFALTYISVHLTSLFSTYGRIKIKPSQLFHVRRLLTHPRPHCAECI